MIKNILVPMGSSRFSQNALNMAVEIGNIFRSNIRILYIEDISKIKDIIFASKAMGGVSLDLPGIPEGDSEIMKIREEIQKEKEVVQKYYDDVKGKISGSHIMISREGQVAEEILKDSRISDIIIMGKVLKKDSDQCTMLQPSIMNVVYKTHIPILAICEDHKLGDHIIIAYDGSRSANNSLRVIANFIPNPIKKVTIIYIHKKEEEAMLILQEAEEYFKPFEVSVEKIWRKGDNVTEIIVNTAKELNASAIVIGGYGDNRLKEFLVGSVTEKVLKSVEIPVLLCNG